MAAPAVEIEGLARSFGDLQAVHPLELHIAEGQTFGLLGPNGAGKTTTLSMLATLLAPSAGDARIAGHSLAREPRAVRRRVGLAPQQVSLYPDLSGEENLLFFASLYAVPRAVARREARTLLERVGLEGRKDDPVRHYSGGMQRRLNLACALVHRPDIVLLDEPTAGVDPQSRDHLLRAIRELAETGTTLIYTTHYMEEAERVCDRIAILDAGRVLAQGSLDELLGLVGLGEVIEFRDAAGRLGDAELAALPGVGRLEREGGRVRLFVERADRALAALATALSGAGLDADGLAVYRVDLERVFMHLTGRDLRD